MNKKYITQFCATLMIVCLSFNLTQAQEFVSDKDTLKKNINQRKLLVGVGSALSYGVSMWGLSTLWYKDYPRVPFHFFNDIRGWYGIDKAGHGTTTYQMARVTSGAWRWAGYSDKKSAIIGSLYSLGIVSTIEYFDGRSEGWGASPPDLIANASGFALFLGQELSWKEQRLAFKWSYYPSRYAKHFPQNLGSVWYESMFKDYNGHTYWLSANIASFLGKDTKIPKWLNVAAGYGADGMLGYLGNPPVDNQGNPTPYFERYVQYYLSFDVDLTKIKTKSKFLRTVLFALNYVKVPMPTVEFNRVQGARFHWLM